MRWAVGILFLASVAVSTEVEKKESETDREKRQLLVLVPQPQHSVVYVPVRPVIKVPAHGVHQCGVPAIICQGSGCESRNVGGIPSIQNEFPWVVQILSNGNHLCAGSLIDNQFILTGASCVEPATPASIGALSVRLGEYNRDSTADGPYIERNVSIAYLHSDYKPLAAKSGPVNDIALLKLNQPVPFTEKIQPICLDDGSVRIDSGIYEAVVAGWGKVAYNRNPLPSKQHKAVVRVNTPQECQNAYAEHGYRFSDDQICAGLSGKDACVGDSGGPLFVKTGPNNWKQVGILSWGISCGGPPGGYTSVIRFRQWIEEVRAANLKGPRPVLKPFYTQLSAFNLLKK